MYKLKCFLFILFIHIDLQNCAVQVIKTKLYPERDGYLKEVPFSKYIKTIKVGLKVYETDKLPDPLLFDEKNSSFFETVYKKPYKGEIATDKLAYEKEDRITRLNCYENFDKGLFVDGNFINLINSKLEAGKSGYMLILFKNPDKNNEKIFIRIHIKRTS